MWLWPHLFNLQNIANVPTSTIDQAVFHGRRLQFRDLHYQEIGISKLTAAFFNINRDPKKTSAFSDADFQTFGRMLQQFEPAEMDAIAANTVMSILTDGSMPVWLNQLLPIEIIKRNANGEDISTPRIWSCPGLALISPERKGGQIVTPLAVLDEDIKDGVNQLYDFDTEEPVAVVNVYTDGQAHYRMGTAVFEEVV